MTPADPSSGVSGWSHVRVGRHTGPVTTRLGFAVIALGIVLLVLRGVGLVDSEVADIAATMALVGGALSVAIAGETERD